MTDREKLELMIKGQTVQMVETLKRAHRALPEDVMPWFLSHQGSGARVLLEVLKTAQQATRLLGLLGQAEDPALDSLFNAGRNLYEELKELYEG